MAELQRNQAHDPMPTTGDEVTSTKVGDRRYALLLAGRGSYTERSLGTLAAAMRDPELAPLVERTEELRREFDLPSLLELDAAERFSAAHHLRPANVSALIWLCTWLDATVARRRELPEHGGWRLVGIAGNSMGWYTGLSVGGALSFDDGFRLVQGMALLQEEPVGGGQLLYPIMDEQWRTSPGREALVQAALDSSGGEALPSIELGGFRVLAGTDAGLSHLSQSLPVIELGKNRYPMKLVQHGPYHTGLLSGIADRARERFTDLGWERPDVCLVDGRGSIFTPWSASLPELREYTLGHQITKPYDFSRSIRILLRELAPDRLVLPGPGNTLGSITGQVMIQEGWRRVRSRADFEALQSQAEPFVESMRR